MSNGCVNWWWLATETAGVTGARDGELLWQWAQRVGWDTAAETLGEAIVSVAVAVREGERISAVVEPFVERIDRLETELAQLRAQRDWLARQLSTMDKCPYAKCPGDINNCNRGNSIARDCWLRAAEAAKPEEATE